jgi:hypothetical protein
MTKQSDGITMQGRYDVHATSISFTPRFPFARGVTYVATFYTEELTKNYNEVYLPEIRTGTLTLEFSLPVKKPAAHSHSDLSIIGCSARKPVKASSFVLNAYEDR